MIVDSPYVQLSAGLLAIVIPSLVLRWYGLVPGIIAFVVMFVAAQGTYRLLYGRRRRRGKDE